MKNHEELPIVLQAKHVSQLLGLAKSTTYEIMKQADFPLLEVSGRKIVYKDDFFEWLDSKKRRGVVKV